MLGKITATINGNAVVKDDFDDGNISEYTLDSTDPNASVTMLAAHDGTFGLEDRLNYGMGGWIVGATPQLK